MKKIIIIGAGLGGLSAAIRLAKSGFDVTITEKNETVGGKVNSVEANGYKFDTGASLLTMRHVFEDLFNYAERDIKDYLDLVPLDPICRYFWTDKTVFDASSDIEKTVKEIERVAPDDVENFRKYLADAKRNLRLYLVLALADLREESFDFIRAHRDRAVLRAGEANDAGRVLDEIPRLID